MQLIHIALALDGTVVAHFMNWTDSAEFCSAKGLTNMAYNLNNRDGEPAPLVGSIDRA